MTSFPIFYFLFPYALFLLVFIVFSLFNVYHLLRYGIYNFNLYVLCTVYMAGTLLILGASVIMILQFDWTVPLQLSSIFAPDLQLDSIYDATR
ncbi:hypothetical protein KJ910_01785 [Patescibacteria group bacterium]|nr:hypothetical protein [Patescibacteria group bacterium]MBU1907426.1 hypothetical protein [Patescibacteria group bacterium]